MNYETIADIYSANAQIRERLLQTIGSLARDEESALPEGEKWSVRKIVEHLSMVEYGTCRICTRLIAGAKTAGKPSDGRVLVSDVIAEKSAYLKDIKVEAPERVQPTGEISIEESLAKMSEVRAAIDEMQTDLEVYDVSEQKFPHPYFGELTAAEWLIVMGGHEARHLKQIEKLVEKIRQ